jgi:hypothetical protein
MWTLKAAIKRLTSNNSDFKGEEHANKIFKSSRNNYVIGPQTYVHRSVSFLSPVVFQIQPLRKGLAIRTDVAF